MLAVRSSEPELLETGCATYEDYQHCLADLARVNMVTMTHGPMLRWLRSVTTREEPVSVLDVACGYGDALRRIRRWNRNARLSGIDRHPWSVRAAREATAEADAVTYHEGDVFAFAPAEPFDVVISSQFAHHLTNEELVCFLRWMERHARRGWFIGDLHRHWLSYYGFGVLATVAGWHKLVRYDGRVSISRAFLASELRGLVAAAGVPSEAVSVRWHVPFRLSVARRWTNR